MQRCLVKKRALHDSLDWLHGGGEPVEVQQRLGREDARYADLVVDRSHRSIPWRVEVGRRQISTVPPIDAQRSTHHG